jgi:hypothetical protein
MDIVGTRYSSSSLTTNCPATSLSGTNLIRILFLEINLEARLVAGNQNAGNRMEASYLAAFLFFLFLFLSFPFSLFLFLFSFFSCFIYYTPSFRVLFSFDAASGFFKRMTDQEGRAYTWKLGG